MNTADVTIETKDIRDVLDKKVKIGKREAVHLRDRYLGNYAYLQKVVHEVDGPLAIKLLCLEVNGKNREQVVSRLYGIYSKWRRENERQKMGLAKDAE